MARKRVSIIREPALSSHVSAGRWIARWPYALYALVSVAFCAPLFAEPDGLGINDWDQHLFYYGAVIKSVVEYGQLPFWNPWYCGGNVLWQNPQIPLLSPVFPLAALMSLPLAMKVNIVLHYFVGLAGMHALLRSIGVRFRPAALYLAATATLGGAVVLHLSVGHSVFLPCLYIPLQLYFVVRATRNGAIRDIAIASALLALMIYNGAFHVVPMSVALVGVLAVTAAISRREWRPLVVAGAVALGGFALAAPKLLPVALWISSDQFVDARTVLERPDQMTGEMLMRAYLDRFQHRGLRFGLQRSAWHEYGNYVGTLAALLIVTSVVWALIGRGTRDRWLGLSFGAAAVVLFLLSAGEFSAWAPASLAGHVPLFSNFRIPSRYTIAAVIAGAATVGWAVQTLEAEGSLGRVARRFIGAILVLGALDVVLVNRAQFDRVFSIPSLDRGFSIMKGVKTLEVDTTSNAYTPDSPMFRSLMNNRAFFHCYESLQTRRVATAGGPLLDSDGKARIFEVTFSPNRVAFSVAGGREPSEVRLNQNFAKGWRSSAGDVVPGRETGQPSVLLDAGQTGTFAFSFAPPGLMAGMGACLVALAGFGWGWRRTLPERRRGD